MHVQAAKGGSTNGGHQGLVQNTEHGDDVLPLRLRDEFRDDTNVVEGALSVGETHDTVEEVVLAGLSTMVVSVGRSGDVVEVEIDTDTVLPAPLEDSDNVPKLPGLVWFKRST